MPTNRRPRIRARRGAPLNKAQISVLVTGLEFFGGFDDDRDRERGWKLLGPGIVAAHAEALPGTRPEYWWRYDAPEPRRRLGGRGTGTEDAALWYGAPGSWDAYDPDDPPMFESQAAYLKRIDLFLPGEAARLEAADFEPEEGGGGPHLAASERRQLVEALMQSAA